MTPDHAPGLVAPFLAVWMAIGGWWVVALYVIHRLFTVFDKHGVQWLGDWLTSKAEISFLKSHVAKCDQDLADLKGNFSDLFAIAREMDRRHPENQDKPPPDGIEKRMVRTPSPPVSNAATSSPSPGGSRGASIR